MRGNGEGHDTWGEGEGGGHGLCDPWDGEWRWRRFGERSGGGTHGGSGGLAMEGRGVSKKKSGEGMD